jgi:hypothetical protein
MIRKVTGSGTKNETFMIPVQKQRFWYKNKKETFVVPVQKQRF